MTCAVIAGTRTITLTSGLTSAIAGGSTVSLVFGPMVNPSDSSGTTSMVVTTYTDATTTYIID
jgi:hypothetical protein